MILGFFGTVNISFGSDNVFVEDVLLIKDRYPGTWGVRGKVHNLSDSPVKGTVTIKFLDSSGDIISSTHARVNDGDPINSNQAAHFEYWASERDFEGVVDFKVIFKER